MGKLRIWNYAPGERIYDKNTDKIDSFHLILDGKVGIFNPEKKEISKIADKYTTIVYCNE